MIHGAELNLNKPVLAMADLEECSDAIGEVCQVDRKRRRQVEPWL